MAKSTTPKKNYGSAASRRSESLRDFRAISAVEGLRPTDEMKRVFEMFERENWSDERRRAYLLERYGNGPR